jgi:transposase
MFYKTLHGARVGDMYMSLIQTCELNGVNAFEYLTQLLRQGEKVAEDAAKWMPWNYPAASADALGDARYEWPYTPSCFVGGLCSTS